MHIKGVDPEAPADGSKGGLSKITVAGLSAVVANLRKKQPSAKFALIYRASDDPTEVAEERKDAGVPCHCVENVIVEFGAANVEAKVLAFLVRSAALPAQRCALLAAARTVCSACRLHARATQDGHGKRPLQIFSNGPDPTFGAGVYATRDLTEGQPIDYDGGVLWEDDDLNESEGGKQSTRQLCTHDLDAELLRPFGYKGPALVSSLNTHAGYNLHYNDPSMYSSPSRHAGTVEANIGAFLIIDLRPSPRLRIGIMYFTARPVAKGEELLQDWGEGTWAALSGMFLDGQARCAHWYHRYETRLRIRAAARNLGIAPAQLATVPPLSGELVSFNPSEGGVYGIADYVIDDIGVKDAPDVAYVRWSDAQAKKEERQVLPAAAEGMRLLGDEEVSAAFAAAHCDHAEEVDVSRLSAATRLRLSAYKNLFPAANEAQSVLLRGKTPPKVVLAEVMATYNPARWMSAPDTPAHALVVRPGFTIEEGEPVCLYAGRMWTDAAFNEEFPLTRQQYYAYEVPLVWSGVDIVESCRNANLPKPPTLVIEALNAGGIGRFINDCWSREGGKKTVNVEPRAVWDAEKMVPAIVMIAVKRIDENEELVSDYSESFWKVVWTELRVLQTEFWRRCAARVQFLERRLRDAGVPLPKLPDPLTGPVFIGARPQIDPADDSSDDEEDQGHESDSGGGRQRGGAAGSAAAGSGADKSRMAAAVSGDEPAVLLPASS